MTCSKSSLFPSHLFLFHFRGSQNNTFLHKKICTISDAVTLVASHLSKCPFWVQCQIQLGELGNEWVVATCLFLQETVGKNYLIFLNFHLGIWFFSSLEMLEWIYGLPLFGAIWSVPMFLPVQGRWLVTCRNLVFIGPGAGLCLTLVMFLYFAGE